MKKYATLLIQHMENMYTMEKQDVILSHGFLAIHHDIILACGEGDGAKYIDKDTRIIEGRGHIVIPGFCDVDVTLCDADTTHASGDQIRHMLQCSHLLMKHGTLIGNQTRPFSKQEESYLEVFAYPHMFDAYHQKNLPYPVLYPFQTTPLDEKKPFCISCGYPKQNVLDQLLCAKWMYHQYHLNALTILKACTIYPAQALSLQGFGQIKKGAIANVLILQGSTLEEVFSRIHGEEHMQVIKAGTRIFPSILI